MVDCGPLAKIYVYVQKLSVSGHITNPVPLMEKNRASCLGGRFSHSFIHLVGL